MPVSASCLKRFLDHFVAQPPLKNISVQSTFSFLQLNCSGAKQMYKVQELRNTQPRLYLYESLGGTQVLAGLET